MPSSNPTSIPTRVPSSVPSGALRMYLLGFQANHLLCPHQYLVVFLTSSAIENLVSPSTVPACIPRSIPSAIPSSVAPWPYLYSSNPRSYLLCHRLPQVPLYHHKHLSVPSYTSSVLASILAPSIPILPIDCTIMNPTCVPRHHDAPV